MERMQSCVSFIDCLSPVKLYLTKVMHFLTVPVYFKRGQIVLFCTIPFSGSRHMCSCGPEVLVCSHIRSVHYIHYANVGSQLDDEVFSPEPYFFFVEATLRFNGVYVARIFVLKQKEFYKACQASRQVKGKHSSNNILRSS